MRFMRRKGRENIKGKHKLLEGRIRDHVHVKKLGSFLAGVEVSLTKREKLKEQSGEKKEDEGKSKDESGKREEDSTIILTRSYTTHRVLSYRRSTHVQYTYIHTSHTCFSQSF